MLGRMQNWPLNVFRLIDHAALNAGHQEIVSMTVEGPTVRTNWKNVRERAKRIAQALRRLGIEGGDRVGTLAWNTHRHVECWFAISGMGAVAHTINPRLFSEQIIYIANHASDRALFFDAGFIKLVEEIAPSLTSVKYFIVMSDASNMPASSLDLICYEDLVSAQDGDFSWLNVDENAPSGLCYTSGTTGNPKGVLYSHRSTVLHSYSAAQFDSLGLSSRATVLPIVPMYHANAWGIPYAAALTGAKLVMAGPHFDAATLIARIREEGVTHAAAVPTIWQAILQFLDEEGGNLGQLQRLIVGGAAAPRSLIEAYETRFGLTVCHAWGMTEMSPIGSVGMLDAAGAALEYDDQLTLKCKQGRAPFGVELRIVGSENQELPRDGKTAGRLKSRGAWVIAEYFGGDGGAILDEDGWFDTGDVATIDASGYMKITDRSKDVIKSGGEWISSIDLENAAVGHPGIAEAAVIGIPHPKWDERPILIAVRKKTATTTAAELLDFLSTKVAKWWLPDEIYFVDDLPHTATGKIQKTTLRTQFGAGPAGRHS
ncbi:long-chain fatty acid--CoA ligase [Sphingosinicella sp.]|uniref:long-chain fatty acid--CoA ligase n=1 Tax=Sphingosinicella sp. TaxID=1917971 RepID=UPI001807C98F|nr:long-chain fatty acid--CoA ligase [Sphingosinicella sp.]MBA4758310.1 long-chain fatty acid--CoA ligase [Sphingosinicella sp.]